MGRADGSRQGYGIAPAGLAALDIARIEAALLLKEVDYNSTRTTLIEARKSSLYEAGAETGVGGGAEA